MKIKPRSGRVHGDIYQRWVGVKLICDWFTEPPKSEDDPPWLKEEIDRETYGIFDDILMYKDSIFYFYQIKHTIKLPGDTIEVDDLLNSNASNISIDKMYSAYKLISRKCKNKCFELIIYSNRSIDSSLKRIITNDGQFEDPFVRGSVRNDEKKLIRGRFKELCGEPNDFGAFLAHLRFICPLKHPKLEVLEVSGLSDNNLATLYELVNKAATVSIFKISYTTPAVQRLFNRRSLKSDIKIEKSEKSIDFDLVFGHLDWLLTENLPLSNVLNRLGKIKSEIHQIYYLKDRGADDLSKIKKIVEALSKFMNDKSKEIIEMVTHILVDLVLNPPTFELVKNKCYSFLKECYEKGNKGNSLSLILVRFGYFDDKPVDAIKSAVYEKNKKLLEIFRTNNMIDKLKREERNKLYDWLDRIGATEINKILLSEINHWLHLLLN